MTFSNVEALLKLIHEVVPNHPTFFQTIGAGQGNKDSNAFVKAVQSQVAAFFGENCKIEQKVGDSGMAVDYYFPDDKTIVEVARLVKNPNSEFHKDILKAMLAKSYFEVEHLIFFGGPGSKAACERPARRAIIDWVEAEHDIHIKVYDITTSSIDVLTGMVEGKG